MIVDFDDFGVNRKISDQCESHDCSDKLVQLKELNPNFKVTLFAIPEYVTPALGDWVHRNRDWIELAVHGFTHSSNYECEILSYGEFNNLMRKYKDVIERYFVKGFKAPGWQISDDAYLWLKDNGWWIADQDYNTPRRPEDLPAYINRDGTFFAHNGKKNRDWIEEEAWHGHTWNCVGNGIYETFDKLKDMFKDVENFKFVGEVLK